MHADSVATANWWAGSRGANRESWIENYQKSLQVRHRTAISQIVGELQPSTLLEVGCHCGPNLIRLAQDYPELSLAGYDVNAEAIAAGKAWVARLGLQHRIGLSVGNLPQGSESIPTGAIDVVVSCYTLAYVAPVDLDAVLYELGRVAKRAIILAEPMDGPPTAMLSGYHEWAHRYRQAVEWVGSWRGMTLTTVPVTPPVDRLNAILVAERSNTR